MQDIRTCSRQQPGEGSSSKSAERLKKAEKVVDTVAKNRRKQLKYKKQSKEQKKRENKRENNTPLERLIVRRDKIYQMKKELDFF